LVALHAHRLREAAAAKGARQSRTRIHEWTSAEA
jgi:hypothetical protein